MKKKIALLLIWFLFSTFLVILSSEKITTYYVSKYGQLHFRVNSFETIKDNSIKLEYVDANGKNVVKKVKSNVIQVSEDFLLSDETYLIVTSSTADNIVDELNLWWGRFRAYRITPQPYFDAGNVTVANKQDGSVEVCLEIDTKHIRNMKEAIEKCKMTFLVIVEMAFMLIGIGVMLININKDKLLHVLLILNRKVEKVQSWMGSYKYLKSTILMTFLSLIIVILFGDFITGDKYWIFRNVASDSYGQVYPMNLDWAARIEQGTNVGGWNFFQGLGDVYSECSISLLTWICYLGQDMVAFLSAYGYILNIFLAAICFYGYLRVMGRSYSASVIGAISYAFCGHMIIRGRWRVMPVEIVCAALLLLAFELFYKKKDCRWLPVAIAFLYVNIGTGYYMLLYVAVLFAYAIFRVCSEKNKVVISRINMFLLSFAISLPIISGSLIGIVRSFGSSRLSEGVETFKEVGTKQQSIFSDIDTIQTAFFRTIGIDIIGSASDYSGTGDILIAPTFYCGLLILFCVPFVFYKLGNTKKIWYSIGLLVSLAYVLVVPLRMIMNGFSGDFFKLSSLWIIILLIYMGTIGFENICKADKGIVKYIVIVTLAGVVASIRFYYFNQNAYFERILLAVGFIVLIGILMLMLVKHKNLEPLLKSIIIFVCGAEIILSCYRYVNTEDCITAEYIDEKKGYSDYTVEALEYINEYEDEEAFRIGKTYASYLYGDSLVQRYMGVKSYVGGGGNNEYVNEFYDIMNMPKRLGQSKYLEEVNYSNEVSGLLGVKYILTKDAMIPNYGYSLLETVGDVKIYENQYPIPLAYIYNSYISSDEFNDMTISEKREAIFQACVLNDDEMVENIKEVSCDRLKRMSLVEKSVEYEWDGKTARFEPNTQEEIIIVRVKFDGSHVRNFYTLSYYNKQGTVTKIQASIPSGTSEDYYVISNENIRKLFFDLADSVKIEELEISFVSKQEYEVAYAEMIDKLADTGVKEVNVDFDNSLVNVSYETEQEGIMVLPIPYDEGWKAYVDGEEQEIIKANIGFLGVLVEEGVHDVSIKYEPTKVFSIKALMYKAGCVLLVAWVVGWTYIYISKNRRERRKQRQ